MLRAFVKRFLCQASLKANYCKLICCLQRKRETYTYIYVTEMLDKLRSYCKLTYLYIHSKYSPCVNVYICYICLRACVCTYKSINLTQRLSLLYYGRNWSEVWTGSEEHFTYTLFVLWNFWGAPSGTQPYVELCEHQKSMHLSYTIAFQDGGCVSCFVLFAQ